MPTICICAVVCLYVMCLQYPPLVFQFCATTMSIPIGPGTNLANVIQCQNIHVTRANSLKYVAADSSSLQLRMVYETVEV